MSAHIETIRHVLCFDCGLDETYRWSDEARDAMGEHNATHHSPDPSVKPLDTSTGPVKTAVNFDREAHEVLDAYIERGLGDRGMAEYGVRY